MDSEAEPFIIQPCPQLGDKADIQRKLTDGLLEALPHVMVHYDVQRQAIVEFGWPVIIHNALKPQKWAEHARWHRFLFPCCLCPSKGWVGNDVYTESKVEVALFGTNTGKWIATCARTRCTYAGESFARILHAQHAERCSHILPAPSTLTTRWTAQSLPRNVTMGINLPRKNPDGQRKGIMRRLARMRGSSADTTEAMSKLCASFRPGLAPSEFYDLFTQCNCELLMTRTAFPNHHCMHTVVVLTDDSSDPGAHDYNHTGQDVENGV
ncbi:hypothetical protein FIBSPDRAFT_889922 [Athelia psychrophila]|uniref:Uncharacterized protein n=1 Tax=Athelia psychrophila TaxID=1759441 RepID=A0A166LKE8_9AGAM|nr:hypothetical protein FIBSPDRAFT_889922 [Fibularhizoctonia sp. CBS 109695]